jgi:hypothetical protein
MCQIANEGEEMEGDDSHEKARKDRAISQGTYTRLYRDPEDGDIRRFRGGIRDSVKAPGQACSNQNPRSGPINHMGPIFLHC